MHTQIDFRLPPAETADPADICNFPQADAEAVLGVHAGYTLLPLLLPFAYTCILK